MAGRLSAPETAVAPELGPGVSVSLMALPAAFSDLMEISSQVEAAIVFDGDEIVASSLADERRSEKLADAIRRLVATAEKTRAGLTQIEVTLPEGHVFAVREAGLLIGATTSPDPPSGLVFYDLRSCLAGLAAEGVPRKGGRSRANAAKAPRSDAAR
jgi:hypothetical protein